MRNPIYTDTKLAGALREQLKKKQEAMIKQIKPKRDSYDYEGCGNSPHEDMGQRTKPKLWYLLAVLKKAGISLDQVGDEMGLTFLGNVIRQFKRFTCSSCNYVCFLHNYFQKVSHVDWPAKYEILKKLTKHLPKMEQTRNKVKIEFNQWWSIAIKQQYVLDVLLTFTPSTWFEKRSFVFAEVKLLYFLIISWYSLSEILPSSRAVDMRELI